jgi:hypothetical protein
MSAPDIVDPGVLDILDFLRSAEVPEDWLNAGNGVERNLYFITPLEKDVSMVTAWGPTMTGYSNC